MGKVGLGSLTPYRVMEGYTYVRSESALAGRAAAFELDRYLETSQATQVQKF